MNSSIEMKAPATPASTARDNGPTYVARHGWAGNDSAPAPERVALRGYYRRSSGGEGRHALANRPRAAEAVSTDWPTGSELYAAARSRRAFVLGEILAAMVDAVAEAARRWIGRYGEHRRAVAARAALAELDDRTLHDIGLDRSEIGSVTAEWIGDAERSRLQLTAPKAPGRSTR